jgi:thiamine pyrophosphate-dependent acetolactate synthase large subunit-like protein
MACGMAKHTGRLGVCVGTTGPGAMHLLNGLYDAKFDAAALASPKAALVEAVVDPEEKPAKPDELMA